MLLGDEVLQVVSPDATTSAESKRREPAVVEHLVDRRPADAESVGRFIDSDEESAHLGRWTGDFLFLRCHLGRALGSVIHQ
jgi:hypothetical protein